MKLEIDGLRKTFTARHGDSVHAVDDITLQVANGEFLVILGPSGSGKTTLLRCIAGLERPDGGEIRVDGRVVYSSRANVWVPPERRDMSMVFQSYALWPHMTVFDNVAYPLKGRSAKEHIPEAVTNALEMVECGTLQRRYPSQLSGGQQQRVALARAIVRGSGTILFDEPLSSVDTRVREELRGQLAELKHRLGFSAVYITHDQTEAVVLADTVAVLANGRILQMGPPRQIYARPTSEYAAEFLGAANRYRGTLKGESAAGLSVQTAVGKLLAARTDFAPTVGQPVSVIVRPEHCRIASTAPDGQAPNTWQGMVERATFLGYCTEYRLRLGAETLITVKSLDRPVLEVGSAAWVHVEPDDVSLVAAAHEDAWPA